jgi:hypothetical protein
VLRPHGDQPGHALPPTLVSTLCQSIAEIDASLPVPATLKQRRTQVNNWFVDNRDRGASEDKLRITRIAHSSTSTKEEIEGARQSGGTIADYHVFITERPWCRIHANRTHVFCRVGDRFLLTCGSAWTELEVMESGGASEGADKGKGVIRSRSAAGVDRRRTEVLSVDGHGPWGGDEASAVWSFFDPAAQPSLIVPFTV